VARVDRQHIVEVRLSDSYSGFSALKGEPPTIDLFMGYNRSNTSPLLKRFLARADELVAAVARRISSDL
jgi:hypothetical protein